MKDSQQLELAIIIPVYNEEGCIEEVISEWGNMLDKLKINYRIIAYDDGSRDKTISILRKLENETPNLEVITNVNKGHGPTILRGYLDFTYAEWLFQVDSDGELKPHYFPAFWKERDQYDFIIGKRNRESNLLRKLITFFTFLTVRLIYGKGIVDINCPYRLMRTESIKPALELIPSGTFAPNVLLSGFACLQNLKIKQIKISHQFRQTGEASLKSFKIIRVAVQSFKETILFRFKLK